MTGLPGFPQAARAEVGRLTWLLLVVNLALPAWLWIYAELDGRAYWAAFRSDGTPLGWFSTLQLLALAALADLIRRLGPAGAANATGGWSWIAFGFFVLAWDEAFNFHETFRDSVLRPLGVFADSAWILPGDVVLYAVFVAGMGLLWRVRRDFDRLARWLILAAVALSLPAIIIDSLRDEILRNLAAWRFWDYVFEEVAEVWAQFLLGLGLVRVLHARLADDSPTIGAARDP